MPLTASNEVILIPSGTTTGYVTINWDFSPDKIKLEERTFKVGSTPGAFQPRVIPSNELVAGSYTQALTPGDLYEVRAFDIDFFIGTKASEEMIARGALGKVVVHALGLPTTLQRAFTEKVGGTFYRYSITTGSAATGPIQTHAIMEVGKEEPTADAAGFRIMPNPIMTVKSFTPAITHHLTTDKVIFGLPAEDRMKLTEARFALIRVSDAAGGWQQIVRPFKTLERRVTINFPTIDVQGLGEAPSETEAEMRFKLEAWVRNGQSWQTFQSFEFENHQTTLAPFNVTNFVASPLVVIGPRPIKDLIAGVAVHVQEFDPWPFEDEHASSIGFGGPRVIEVIPGEGNENKPINMILRASQEYDPFDTEQEVIVDARVTVTVEHVP